MLCIPMRLRPPLRLLRWRADTPGGYSTSSILYGVDNELELERDDGCNSRQDSQYRSTMKPLSISFQALLALGGLGRVAAAPTQARSWEMPLTWNHFGFLAKDTITVGTPPQNVTVFVDWTWISQYLITETCHGTDNTSACLNKEQSYFRTKDSSTFRNETVLFPSRTWNPNHFFFDLDLTVDYASDILAVGPYGQRTVVQAADFQFDQGEDFYPFDGVFGLSPVFANDNGKLCTWPPICSQITHKHKLTHHATHN